jgi:hypothetical protein
LLQGSAFSIDRDILNANCDRFRLNPSLSATPYSVTSSVSSNLFREFLAAIEGASLEITAENSAGLSALSSEFGFRLLSSNLWVSFCKMAERISLHERLIAVLENKVAVCEASAKRFSVLEAEISELKRTVSELQNSPELRLTVARLSEGSKPPVALFSKLTSECGGNPVKSGQIAVTSSGKIGHHDDLSVLFEDTPEPFYTNDVMGSWICIDLKHRRLSLTKYWLKSHSCSSNGRLVEWALFGSQDGTSWNLIDNQKDDKLNELGASACYTLKQATPPYRWFKLQQTGRNSKGWHNLRLGQIEFFGTVEE